ncbi:HAD family hydrolase [Clostridium sp.]|uniref:HAD family hydrolase n=1 Tax=Clostridium sp. TaxID=1506 RepID=UPI00262FFAD3|nr:HAD family hydrolase [uncultured Clostridium sp.]
MIFFDIDGTLLDHKRSEFLGVKAFYIEYKNDFKVEEKSFYNLWCQISDKYFDKYLKGELTFAQHRIERIKELFNYSNIKLSDEEAMTTFKRYLINYENSWMPFDDVIPCLRQLSKYKLGIISNGDLVQQLLKLEKMGIKQYFTDVITAGEVGIAKPNIKLFTIACNRVNKHPQECYYIGDDLYTDIVSCNEIGLKGIWLNRKREPVSVDKIKMIYSLESLKNIL